MSHRLGRLLPWLLLALFATTPSIGFTQTIVTGRSGFLSQVSDPATVVNFDELPGNTLLPQDAYAAAGVRLEQMDGFPLYVGAWLYPYEAALNVPSRPNAISSTWAGAKHNVNFEPICDNEICRLFVNYAASDRIRITFTTPVTAAGIHLGQNDVNGVDVTWLATDGSVIVRHHFNGFNPWSDFVGLVNSPVAIGAMLLENGANDGDAIYYDDLIFTRSPAIRIDPGAYTGEYFVSPFSTPFRGPRDLDLAPGTHVFSNGGGGEFQFDVTASHAVTNVTNSDAALAIGSVLSLKTIEIEVDPQLYTGEYFISGLCCARGAAAFTVLKNLELFFDNRSGGRFSFVVGATGAISAIDNEHAAFARGNVLVLNNVPITIDPQRYEGQYELIGHTVQRGAASFVVVPSLPVEFSNVAGSRFVFNVSDAGQIAELTSPTAYAVGSTLVLNNTCVSVNPGSYTGQYFIQAQPDGLVGPADIFLLSGTRYYFTADANLPFYADHAFLPAAIPLLSTTFTLGVGTCTGNTFPSNTPPILLPGGPYTGIGGTALSISANAFDLDGDVTSIEWDVDADGTFETIGASTVITLISSRQVRVRAIDARGAFSIGTVDVTVVEMGPPLPAVPPLPSEFWTYFPPRPDFMTWDSATNVIKPNSGHCSTPLRWAFHAQLRRAHLAGFR